MRVDHKTTKISSDLNRILSAHAPMISAGVIAANLSWKAKNRISGIEGAYDVLTVFIVRPFNPNKLGLNPIIPPMLFP